MTYLKKNVANLPQVLFLDLNMPRKNGAECLMEIKKSVELKELPVIIYSTSLHEDTATALYNAGAHYYLQKTTLSDLIIILDQVLNTLVETKFVTPGRENFVVNAPLK
jgi:DNA-binding NarL/FixJ family response regulator